MQSADNKVFWNSIRLFLSSPMGDEAKLSDLMSAASGSDSDLSSVAKATLLVTPDHAKRWKGVRAFLKNPDVRQRWSSAFTVKQLKIVASGERGVSLHDNCVALPLYD